MVRKDFPRVIGASRLTILLPGSWLSAWHSSTCTRGV
jgi:hypothetical protein